MVKQCLTKQVSMHIQRHFAQGSMALYTVGNTVPNILKYTFLHSFLLLHLMSSTTCCLSLPVYVRDHTSWCGCQTPDVYGTACRI